MRKAFITGVAGQDGSYLAELLLEKEYEVHGLTRRGGTALSRIQHLVTEHGGRRLFLHTGDIADTPCLHSLIDSVSPDEIYNLAGQSSRADSFREPQYTCETTAIAPMRLIEFLREHREKTKKEVRFYQAGSSEIFEPTGQPQNESSIAAPRSPYAASKLAAQSFGIGYRNAYGLFICNGILFNHESPRRGENFVTRKITRAVGRISAGLEDSIALGNTAARRDWGFAGDYARAMWLMLQAETPDDYVIATGKAHSVAEFCEMAFAHAGLDWRKYVRSDPALLRTAELDHTVGDASKAARALGWAPRVAFPQLVQMMVDSDIEIAKTEKLRRAD